VSHSGIFCASKKIKTTVSTSAARDLLPAAFPRCSSAPVSRGAPLAGAKHAIQKQLDRGAENHTKFPDEKFSRPVPRKYFVTGSNAGKTLAGGSGCTDNATLRYPAVSSSLRRRRAHRRTEAFVKVQSAATHRLYAIFREASSLDTRSELSSTATLGCSSFL
jgi:hypothetical protein